MEHTKQQSQSRIERLEERIRDLETICRLLFQDNEEAYNMRHRDARIELMEKMKTWLTREPG